MTDIPYATGSIIANRNRLWRVDAFVEDVLTATPIDGSETEQRQFYIPYEQIKPGRLAPPSPDRVGYPAAQQLLLRAHRLNMLHGTAPLLSLQRSRVIPKDYQLVPVVMALELPRVRMLIADDVGLGKTIEAGLILTELMARQRAGRILIIVPASLREQWQQQLDYFFHIDARIISSRHRREMERELPVGANPWEYYRVLITSVDYAKQPAIKNQILEQQWDAVLIDEAHLVAKPHQSGPDEHVSMDRWELARALAESRRVGHLLMLTATPHNGYTDTFASLLRMLDVGAVEGPAHEPRIRRELARRYVCQRRRDDVEEWFAEDAEVRSPFPRRDQDEVIVPPTSYEGDALAAVEAYGERVLESARQSGARSYTLARWTALHLHKRALSSPAALRQSLRNRREALQARLEQAVRRRQEQPAGAADAGEEISLPEEVARANVLDEDTGERLTDEEAAYRAERLPFGSPEAIRGELAVLEEVLAAARRVTSSRDGKLQKLLDSTLRERLRTLPRVIIFTRYVDTLEYLVARIEGDRRYEDVDVLAIHGGLNERQRRDVFQAFERAKKGVLVATDAISEGINLQHAAAQVIHYELPWNPNRLEQRNGRVDRFGQPEPVVYIRTMVMDETLDAAILKVLVEKAQRIRREYGFAPPYFGEDTDVLDLIQQHDIKIGPRQLSLFEPPPAALRKDGGDGQDPFDEQTLERIKGDSFYGQTHISLPQIERRLRATEATVGSAEQIRTFVFNGLDRFRCNVEENADGSYRIAITNPALQTAGSSHVIERATFDPEWGLDDPVVTVLDLGHPLVRRLIEEVKQESFYSEDVEHYGRTGYLVTAAAEQVTAVFHLLARYVVHTEPTTIVEELLPVALPVYSLNPSLLEQEVAQELLDAAPSPETRTVDEVQETLADALAIPGRDVLLSEAVATRREQLAAERREMRRQLEERADGGVAAWLKGIDRLSEGSWDMLAVTVYYPE